VLADLEQDDAEWAYRAVWELASAPGDSVPFLRAALGPGVADARNVQQMIAALDENRRPRWAGCLSSVKLLLDRRPRLPKTVGRSRTIA
jgi:hypothetical protein